MVARNLYLLAVFILVVGIGIGFVSGVLGKAGDRTMSVYSGSEWRGNGMVAGVGRSNGQTQTQQKVTTQTKASGTAQGKGVGGWNRGNCVGDECLFIEGLNYPAGELTDAAEKALALAIDDEYKARATYEAVIEKFGSIRPFIMIIRAEEQHIAALKSLYDKYGLEIPADPWTGEVTAPDTVREACQIGVDAEIANAALYRETLIPAVSGFPDIEMVFTNLMNASQTKHLPAFDRCN